MMPDTTRTFVGLIGCLCLFVGIFAPAVELPIIGAKSIANSTDGKIILVLSALGLLATLYKRYRALLATGMLIAITVATDWYLMQNALERGKNDLYQAASNSGDFAESIAELFGASIKMGWAWGALFLGAFMVLAAAFWPTPKE